ncbi:MAG: hypothetical protein AB8B96_04415 [Lysobacterales bacterium]
MSSSVKRFFVACAALTLVGPTSVLGSGQGVPLSVSRAHPDAPEEVKQYGALNGHWRCEASAKQPDGSWKDSPGVATWSWYYVLDGYAVQDVWQPAAATSPMGTNLRTYDVEKKQWNMVWATQTQAEFDHYTAAYSDGMIVMRGENPSRSQSTPAHAAKITFYNMTNNHFDWKYEATAPATDAGWSEFSRMSCSRQP